MTHEDPYTQDIIDRSVRQWFNGNREAVAVTYRHASYHQIREGIWHAIASAFGEHQADRMVELSYTINESEVQQ